MTAVEWLMEQITFSGEFGGRYNSFIETEDLSIYFDKAKEMEKQQIIDAFHRQTQKFYCNEEAEYYYNEKYK